MHSLAASFLAVLVLGVAGGGCGRDGESDGSAGTTNVSTTGSVTTDSPSTTNTEPGSTTSTSTSPSDVSTSAVPQAADPAWALYEDDFFVWGVADDDVLNVRQGPGANEPIVATLAPGQRDVRRYDQTTEAGGGAWGPVQIPGGVGWVNLAFLRPEGTRPPRTEGTLDPRTETAADDVQALLGAGEYDTLSGFIDPTRGLTISLHAFVAHDAVVLTPAEVAGAATDSDKFLWGYTDGEGRPVETTIVQRLRAIAGDPGLTSTDVIGHDVRVGLGNSIDNIAERFPGSKVVEYHFEGTSIYGDFDWSSVRFVFDIASPAPTGRPALLAIVQDTWTI